jgi:hypothetical protein
MIVVPFSFTLGRYIMENIRSYIMETNHFFFNSDKLKEGGITYEVNNWGGADNFEIQFELNNHKNNILTSEGDIEYSVNATCDETSVICNLSSNSGVIYEDEKTDNFHLTVIPRRAFQDEESVTVIVTATSSTPYIKTLSATYVITVGKRGISYQITDSVNSPYLMFSTTNAIDTYTVRTAFGGHTVGEIITMNEYISLSAADKAKCASALITLSWDPSDVVIDTTSNIVTGGNATFTTSTHNGISYIDSITFPVDILSSTEVRFYKWDVTKNYTYPFTYPTPIVTFSAS